MIRIFRDRKNDSNFVVHSTCIDSESFMAEFAEALSKLAKEQEDYAVLATIKTSFPILLKLSGYKADEVREERSLVCGNVSPENCDVISSAGR